MVVIVLSSETSSPAQERRQIMFFPSLVRSISVGCCLAFTGCASHSPQVPWKWVPYQFQGATLSSGMPAFFLVHEGPATACARKDNVKQCEQNWEKMPETVPLFDSNEIEYFAYYLEDGVQATRLTKTSFCAVMRARVSTGQANYTCNELWSFFTAIILRLQT